MGKIIRRKKDAGYICRHCGISRPTLRKWFKRYQESGLDGLKEQIRKPHNSPNRKLNKQIEEWVLAFRKNRNLGARRVN